VVAAARTRILRFGDGDVAPSAGEIARWIVDTLRALDALVSTGRWRCYCPSMPGWWASG
jgi:hypothetical protein